ncbi:hypothetical protein HCG45_07880 [Pseudomonas fulva]|nr:hypothetical protein [Pseudomonas fulva]
MANAVEACGDFRRWHRFVSATECSWQIPPDLAALEAWQTLWFEMEILNGLALGQWEDQGRPADWSQCWCDQYQKEALALVSDLARLLEQLDSSKGYSRRAQKD